MAGSREKPLYLQESTGKTSYSEGGAVYGSPDPTPLETTRFDRTEGGALSIDGIYGLVFDEPEIYDKRLFTTPKEKVMEGLQDFSGGIGNFLKLLDPNKDVRSFYDGWSPDQIDRSEEEEEDLRKLAVEYPDMDFEDAAQKEFLKRTLKGVERHQRTYDIGPFENATAHFIKSAGPEFQAASLILAGSLADKLKDIPPEDPNRLFKWATMIKEDAENTWPGNPDMQKSFWLTTIPSAFGSVVAAGFPGMIARRFFGAGTKVRRALGTGAIAATGTAQITGEIYNSARASGIPHQQAVEAVGMSAAVLGSLEIFHLNRVMDKLGWGLSTHVVDAILSGNMGKAHRIIRTSLKESVIGGGREGLTEFMQQAGINKILTDLGVPEEDLASLTESGLAGLVVGLVTGGYAGHVYGRNVEDFARDVTEDNNRKINERVVRTEEGALTLVPGAPVNEENFSLLLQAMGRTPREAGAALQITSIHNAHNNHVARMEGRESDVKTHDQYLNSVLTTEGATAYYLNMPFRLDWETLSNTLGSKLQARIDRSTLSDARVDALEYEAGRVKSLLVLDSTGRPHEKGAAAALDEAGRLLGDSDTTVKGLRQLLSGPMINISEATELEQGRTGEQQEFDLEPSDDLTKLVDSNTLVIRGPKLPDGTRTKRTYKAVKEGTNEHPESTPANPKPIKTNLRMSKRMAGALADRRFDGAVFDRYEELFSEETIKEAESLIEDLVANPTDNTYQHRMAGVTANERQLKDALWIVSDMMVAEHEDAIDQTGLMGMFPDVSGGERLTKVDENTLIETGYFKFSNEVIEDAEVHISEKHPLPEFIVKASELFKSLFLIPKSVSPRVKTVGTVADIFSGIIKYGESTENVKAGVLSGESATTGLGVSVLDRIWQDGNLFGTHSNHIRPDQVELAKFLLENFGDILNEHALQYSNSQSKGFLGQATNKGRSRDIRALGESSEINLGPHQSIQSLVETILHEAVHNLTTKILRYGLPKTATKKQKAAYKILKKRFLNLYNVAKDIREGKHSDALRLEAFRLEQAILVTKEDLDKLSNSPEFGAAKGADLDVFKDKARALGVRLIHNEQRLKAIKAVIAINKEPGKTSGLGYHVSNALEFAVAVLSDPVEMWLLSALPASVLGDAFTDAEKSGSFTGGLVTVAEMVKKTLRDFYKVYVAGPASAGFHRIGIRPHMEHLQAHPSYDHADFTTTEAAAELTPPISSYPGFTTTPLSEGETTVLDLAIDNIVEFMMLDAEFVMDALATSTAKKKKTAKPPPIQGDFLPVFPTKEQSSTNFLDENNATRESSTLFLSISALINAIPKDVQEVSQPEASYFPNLKADIQETGILKAISIDVVDDELEITDGVHRVIAAQQLGITEARISIVPNVYDNPEKREAFMKIYMSHFHREADVQDPSAIDRTLKQTEAGTGATRGLVRVATDGRFILELFETGDIFTVVHELGHIYFRGLDDAHLELVYPYMDKVTKIGGLENAETAIQLLKNDPDKLTPDEWGMLEQLHEKFANAFTKYMAAGRSPSKKYAQLFESFRQWGLAIFGEAQKQVNINNSSFMAKSGTPNAPGTIPDAFAQIFRETFLPVEEVLQGHLKGGRQKKFKIFKKKGKFFTKVPLSYIQSTFDQVVDDMSLIDDDTFVMSRLTKILDRLRLNIREASLGLPQEDDSLDVEVTHLIYPPRRRISDNQKFEDKFIFGLMDSSKNSPDFVLPTLKDLELHLPDYLPGMDFDTSRLWTRKELQNASKPQLNNLIRKWGVRVHFSKDDTPTDEKFKRRIMVNAIIDKQSFLQRTMLTLDPLGGHDEAKMEILMTAMNFTGEAARFTARRFKRTMVDSLIEQVENLGGSLPKEWAAWATAANAQSRSIDAVFRVALLPLLRYTSDLHLPVSKLNKLVMKRRQVAHDAMNSLRTEYTVGAEGLKTKFSLFAEDDVPLYADTIRDKGLTLSKEEQKIMDMWYDFVKVTGKLAEDFVGKDGQKLQNYIFETVVDEVTGKTSVERTSQDFKAARWEGSNQLSGRKWPRQFTSDAMTVFMSHDPTARRVLARVLALMNNMQEDFVLKQIEEISRNTPTRYVGVEVMRAFPVFPDFITVPVQFGKEESSDVQADKPQQAGAKGTYKLELIESNPFHAALFSANNLSIRLGFISQFSQDRDTMEEAIKAVVDSRPPGQRAYASKVVKYLVRSLNGIPIVDEYEYAPGSSAHFIATALASLNTVEKAKLLGRAFAPNALETIMTLPTLFGYKNYLKSLGVVAGNFGRDVLSRRLFKKLSDPDISLMQDAADRSRGGVHPLIVSWHVRRRQGNPAQTISDVADIMSSIMLRVSPFLPIVTMNELLAAVSADFFVQDLSKGQDTIGNRLTLELMKFRPEQIDRMVKGHATDAEYAQVVNMAPMITQGTGLKPSERNEFHLRPTKAFVPFIGGLELDPTILVPYWGYIRRVMQSTLSIWDTTMTAADERNYVKAGRSAVRFASFMGHRATGGLLTAQFIYLMKYGNFWDMINWDGDDEDVLDEDALIWFFRDALATSMMAGTSTAMFYNFKRDPSTDVLSSFVGTLPITGFFQEVYEVINTLDTKYTRGNPGRYASDTFPVAVLKFMVNGTSNVWPLYNSIVSNITNIWDDDEVTVDDHERMRNAILYDKESYLKSKVNNVLALYAIGNKDTRLDFAINQHYQVRSGMGLSRSDILIAKNSTQRFRRESAKVSKYLRQEDMSYDKLVDAIEAMFGARPNDELSDEKLAAMASSIRGKRLIRGKFSRSDRYIYEKAMDPEALQRIKDYDALVTAVATYFPILLLRSGQYVEDKIDDIDKIMNMDIRELELLINKGE